MKVEVIFRTSIQLTYYSDSAGLFISLQEAESKMRMMQQKLRQEEKDLMWSSCETTPHPYSQRSGHKVPQRFHKLSFLQ